VRGRHLALARGAVGREDAKAEVPFLIHARRGISRFRRAQSGM
jgi:hypothetical protein